MISRAPREILKINSSSNILPITEIKITLHTCTMFRFRGDTAEDVDEGYTTPDNESSVEGTPPPPDINDRPDLTNLSRGFGNLPFTQENLARQTHNDIRQLFDQSLNRIGGMRSDRFADEMESLPNINDDWYTLATIFDVAKILEAAGLLDAPPNEQKRYILQNHDRDGPDYIPLFNNPRYYLQDRLQQFRQNGMIWLSEQKLIEVLDHETAKDNDWSDGDD